MSTAPLRIGIIGIAAATQATRGEVWMVDAKTGEAKSLLSSPPPHSSYESASAGPGDRTLCTVRTTDEGDIWMLSLDPGNRP